MQKAVDGDNAHLIVGLEVHTKQLEVMEWCVCCCFDLARALRLTLRVLVFSSQMCATIMQICLVAFILFC